MVDLVQIRIHHGHLQHQQEIQDITHPVVQPVDKMFIHQIRLAQFHLVVAVEVHW
jgi:hypothetical protein